MRKIALILTVFVSFTLASPTATEIMRELRFVYQTQKVDLFINQYFRERQLTPEQAQRVRERIDFFFDSDLFIETGVLYLTRLFSEQELTEIYNYLLHGTSAGTATRRMNNLFRRLDPLLFEFLRHNVVGE